MTCFTCGMRGHRAVFCGRDRIPSQQNTGIVVGSGQGQGPPLSAPVANTRRQCFNCGEYGHMRQECPRQTVICYIFGEPGHRHLFCRYEEAPFQPSFVPASVRRRGQGPPQQLQIRGQRRVPVRLPTQGPVPGWDRDRGLDEYIMDISGARYTDYYRYPSDS